MDDSHSSNHKTAPSNRIPTPPHKLNRILEEGDDEKVEGVALDSAIPLINKDVNDKENATVDAKNGELSGKNGGVLALLDAKVTGAKDVKDNTMMESNSAGKENNPAMESDSRKVDNKLEKVTEKDSEKSTEKDTPKDSTSKEKGSSNKSKLGEKSEKSDKPSLKLTDKTNKPATKETSKIHQPSSKLPELTKSQLLDFKNQNKDKDKLQSPIPLNPPPSIISSSSSTPIPQQTSNNVPLPPTVLNKSTLSNLNKSLKAKQKIINLNQPHPKNNTLISEIITSSPQMSKFPNSISEPDLPSSSQTPIPPQLNSSMSNNNLNNNTSSANVNAPLLPPPPPSESGTTTPKSINNNTSGSNNNNDISNIVSNKLDLVDDSGNAVDSNNNNTIASTNAPKEPSTLPRPKKEKQKKITKQNSTRTDFFAAKLASAVDDVDSSDSDETFVYDNNDNNANSANANIAPGTLNLDNNSIHGSIHPQSIYSPSFHEIPNPFESNQFSETPQTSLNQKAQNLKLINNATPPIQPTNRPPSIANSFSSNHYLESTHNSISGNNPGYYTKDHKRLGSRKSISTFRSNDDPVNTIKLYTDKAGHHSPTSAYNESAVPNFNREPSFNDNYSYDDEVEDYADDVSSDGEYYRNQPGASNNTPACNNGVNTTITPSTNDDKSGTDKLKKKSKSSSTSSKLRSTTSKLFDKKGSQPRRYSIIPDDIDIEDFDDDLIYYDNNIRFPYGPSGGGGPSETSPLVTANQKIPHYRSLNMNFPGGKRVLSGKRYMSTGQASPNLNNNNNNNFPFNYDQQQQYYYDFDEFDEEAQLDGDQKRYRTNGKGRYNHPHLSPSNNHFYLPRKTSKDFGSNRGYCIRSFIYTLLAIFCILGIGFVMGYILATTKELEEVSIMSIESPIVSEDELVFNIVVEAINPGWSTIEIEDVELDIFAKSGYLPDDGDDDEETYRSKIVETVLLGTITSLEVPISFAGGLFNKEHEEQVGEIKLFSPGKNLTNILRLLSDKHSHGNGTIPDNSKKWEIISKNPFDLIVRGVLKYNLPLGSKPKLAQVNKVGYIDPSHADK